MTGARGSCSDGHVCKEASLAITSTNAINYHEKKVVSWFFSLSLLIVLNSQTTVMRPASRSEHDLGLVAPV